MVIAGPVRSSLSLKERGLLMRYLPDGEQMKKADQYTIQQIGVPSVVLMERAALKIVEVLEEKKKDLRRPLIVCGSGNMAEMDLLWQDFWLKRAAMWMCFLREEKAL